MDPAVNATERSNEPADSARPSPDAVAIWRGLRALVVDEHDHRKEACDDLDLGFVRIKALHQLAVAPLSMRDLATVLLTDAPYATVIVDDLEARALVRRTVNPADRRSKLVELTAAGQDAARRSQDILNRPPDQLVELTDTELRNLQRVIRKLSRDG
jgi:DNA-binding MarR family transcriptional regulator